MRLLLVDDHALFLEGLRYLLSTYGIEVAGVARDGREALEMARTLRPDLVLLDIRMPGMGGLDTLRALKDENPTMPVAMLTTSDEDGDLMEALRCGASGYLLKSTDATTLVELLGELERGELALSPGLAARMLGEFDAPCPTNLPDAAGLTGRQREILELIAAGHTYKEAGELLGITERTMKYHMGRIVEALHLKNRSQVIAYAGRLGLGRAKPPEG